MISIASSTTRPIQVVDLIDVFNPGIKENDRLLTDLMVPSKVFSCFR